MKNKFYSLLASSVVFLVSCEKDPEIIYETITVTETETVTVQVQPPTPDTQTVGGGGIYFIDDSQTWTNDRIWIMNGKVVVRNGGTLTIQEGTIIKAEDGQGTDATALVIAKGGTLTANGTAESPIVFTDKAKDQIQKITSESKSKKYFRISVKGGGCSGFKYSFSFDDSKKDDDIEFENTLIDKASLEIINGSTIDFKVEMIGESFVINNPNASSSCGCGLSFSV